MKTVTPLFILALLCACAVSSGCVQRSIAIHSEPPGAQCYLDSEYVGATPLELPFTFYGEREIVLRLEGYMSLREVKNIKPPWFEYIPFDFFAENLYPGEIEDKHEFLFVMEPFVLSEEIAERERYLDELLKRAEKLRDIERGVEEETEE